MLSFALEMAGCPDVSSHFMSNKNLLDIIEQIRPGHLANVAQRRREAGKSTRWSTTPAKSILDWAYGLDVIIRPTEQQCFGYDVTCDPARVAEKLQKLESSRPLWETIGIQKVGVILVLYNSQDWGYGALTSARQKDWVDHLLDKVV
jgi:hypothetical protein